MFAFSDNKAPYLLDIGFSDFPANTQRVLRTSIDYFCRWADAHLVIGDISEGIDPQSLVSLYSSHLTTLHISQNSMHSKLKHADSFVLWLQNANLFFAKPAVFSTTTPSSLPVIDVRVRKSLFALLFLVLIVIIGYRMYPIVRSSFIPARPLGSYYPITSHKSILILLSPSSPVLSLSTLSFSTIEFRFIGSSRDSITADVICPSSSTVFVPKDSSISVSLLGCKSNDAFASSIIDGFTGYIDVFVDDQYVARRLVN
ncbi:MAG: hypothetical protein WCO78_02535 [Candidatus Roizmanbacteria bacterium]